MKEVEIKFTASLVALLFLVAVSCIAQASSSSRDADPRTMGSATQISGCLQGTPNGYRLVADSGNPHILMGDYAVLKEHVGNRVTLRGYRDNNRDASASGDEGTARRMRFFQVDDLTADNGKCGLE